MACAWPCRAASPYRSKACGRSRGTPSLWNLAWAPFLFWDGRAAGLEAQAEQPIEAHDEMGQPLAALAGRLAADPARDAPQRRGAVQARRLTADAGRSAGALRAGRGGAADPAAGAAAPGLRLNSGVPDPGQVVTWRLDPPGHFVAFGIHPRTRLEIEVAEDRAKR